MIHGVRDNEPGVKTEVCQCPVLESLPRHHNPQFISEDNLDCDGLKRLVTKTQILMDAHTALTTGAGLHKKQPAHCLGAKKVTIHWAQNI